MTTHAVHKINLRIPASDYTEAVRLQGLAKHWVQHSLAPLLNRHLDQLEGTKEEWVVINRIELTLTDFPWNVSDAALQEKIAAAVQLNKKTNVHRDIVSQWLYFLTHSCFQSNAVLKTAAETEAYLLTHALKIGVESWQGHTLFLSYSFLQRLFMPQRKEMVKLFLQQWLHVENERTALIYDTLVKQMSRHPALVLDWFTAVEKEALAGEQKRVDQLVQRLWQEHGKEKRVTGDIPNLAQHSVADTKEKLASATLSIACPHAGLVLLLPFLQSFFDNCHLLNEKSFVDTEAQTTAIQLPHFLASGDSFTTEEELVLPKILCGAEVADCYAFQEELSPEMKAESESFLQSLITHWTILKNTSVEGFREAFLRRSGRLSYKEGVYILQVEESGVDILLSQLPWGFRNYPLPWMKETLVTEWY